MGFIDILRELFNNDLELLAESTNVQKGPTFVLLTGLGLLPRLALRLSLLYLPLRRGLLLTDRGVIERRGLEADRDSPLPFETSEYGERLRARPRGDSEAMVVLVLRECRELDEARWGTRGCQLFGS